MRCYGYDCGAVLTRRCERLGDPWHDTPSVAYYRGGLANRRSLCAGSFSLQDNLKLLFR
ncbi:hypothetical protein CMEL01_06592 [Colletotrichum melonis]|uniref:Uncharacterized protein n=1 Tax=Colletotrichum melonis TaxID=1209925 RepID=A0AAI9XK71_9PEZI|nr:hypothetical protein CMEL01_06592 [Colletotrichum melonis]